MNLWSHRHCVFRSKVVVKRKSEAPTEVRTRPPVKISKRLFYNGFVASTTLEGTGETDEFASDDETKVFAKKISDEELLARCGGRTGHRAARHGHRMTAKLERVAQQEGNTPAQSDTEEKEEEGEEEKRKRLKKERKEERRRLRREAEETEEKSDTEEKEEEGEEEKRKRLKKERKEERRRLREAEETEEKSEKRKRSEEDEEEERRAAKRARKEERRRKREEKKKKTA